MKEHKNDYYSILGVSYNSTALEIKQAYRKLALKYHPDLNDGKFSEIFKKINEAYSTLSNKRKKFEYDAANSIKAKRFIIKYSGDATLAWQDSKDPENSFLFMRSSVK